MHMHMHMHKRMPMPMPMHMHMPKHMHMPMHKHMHVLPQVLWHEHVLRQQGGVVPLLPQATQAVLDLIIELRGCLAKSGLPSWDSSLPWLAEVRRTQYSHSL